MYMLACVVMGGMAWHVVCMIVFLNTSAWTCWGTSVGAAAGMEPGCGAKLAPELGCIGKGGGQNKGGIGGNGYSAGPGFMGR